MDPGEPPIIPEYRLRLNVDFERKTYTGSVTFEPPADTPAIALDAEGFAVDRVRVGSEPLEFILDATGHRLLLPHLLPGPVTIEFSGAASETLLVGLHLSRQGGGYILTTQGEPNGIRRIFPCLDRPDRKSRIALTVRTQAGLEVVTNTREESVRDVDGEREWTFAPTPPMPSYLFYLGIGRFDRIEDVRGRVAFRVYTPTGEGTAGRFALESVPRLLAAFEEYYGVPYPLSKLDLIAVAETNFGAMENWGAITFRSTALLADERAPSLARRDIFETLSHELAHQWFGNLVTLSSWKEVWLNESFASFLGVKISERVDPAGESRSDFILRIKGTAQGFEGDSLDSTHPVRVAADRPEEASQVFDEISYGKGATVLGMLEGYLGEERFRQGITDYLERFRYANATTADLWDALGRAAGEPVGPLIDPWLDRPGLPTISARLAGGAVELAQRRFSYHGPLDEAEWPIPMGIDVDGQHQRLRFSTRSTSLPVPDGATVQLNSGALGFYRVRYDPTLHERLLRTLPSRPVTERWMFLVDLLAYLEAEEVEWATYAAAVRALGLSPERLVGESLAATLAELALLAPGSPPVQELAAWFFSSQLARLGPGRRPGERATDGVLRERISFGRVQTDLRFARELVAQHPDWDRVDPDFRLAVAAARARTEGSGGYRELRRLLERARTDNERSALERGLAWSNDPERALETLERASSGELNRGIVHYVIRNVAANPIGRPLLWPWLTERLPRLDALFRGGAFLSYLLEATIPIAGLGRGDAVREYFRTHSYPEGARGVAKGLAQLRVFERFVPTLAALSG